MTRQLRPGFDRVVRRAPLGVQFRDTLDQRVVADGLRVDLLDAQRPDRPLRLHASPGGVFVAHALPGIDGGLDTGFDSSDDAPITSPATRRYSLAVRDTRERYIDTRIALDAPGDGLFAPPGLDGSPAQNGDSPPHVPLYSAPTRPPPGALAVLRADLRLASDPQRPVCWAYVELWLAAVRLAVGISDARGSLLLLFPLPTPREPTRRASPPAGFERLTWDVALRTCWHPAQRAEAVPELCEILAQPAATPLRTRSPDSPLATLQLRAGEPLLAATAGSSFLFVAA